MRSEVKLGIVISAVVVLVAGSYFIYRDRQVTTIPLGKLAQNDGKRDAAKPSTATKKPHQRNKQASNRKKPAGKPKQAAGRKPSSGNKPDRSLSVGKLAGNNGQKKAPPRPKSQIARGIERPPNTKVATKSEKPAPRPQGPRDRNSTSSGDGNNARQAAAKRTLSERRANAPKQGATPAVSSKTKPKESKLASAAKRDAAAMETHRVQPGDTLAALAVAYYGDERFVGLLTRSNPQITDPRALRIGTVVKIPPKADAERSAKKTQSGNQVTDKSQTYTVQAGDSLYAIARDQLGDGGRWEELYKLNRARVGDDPSKLKVGQILTLPQS